MDLNNLVNLSSRAWALTILALLHDGIPDRPAMLIARSGAARSALTQSLLHLVDMGLVKRNPGHGHPLRPEYLLSAAGIPWAGLAGEIFKDISDDYARKLMRRAWTLPLLYATSDSAYYGDLRHTLAPITDRALSQALQHLEQAGWLARRVEDSFRPPRVSYKPTGDGHTIAKLLKEALERGKP